MAETAVPSLTTASVHGPHLAHHFDSPAQQFAAGKLGMWLFLATEILLFAGLFCIYAVYRALHPEVFLRASEYLDTKWGAVNTIVLLCSSFTMAWAVTAAQRSRRKQLVTMLALTLLGGGVFMGIKYVEYKHKWEHHLLWGARFQPADPPVLVPASIPLPATAEQATSTTTPSPVPPPAAAAPAGVSERWQFEPAASGPRGLMRAAPPAPASHARPRDVALMFQFFGVYFALTGLHGLHVLAGMIVLAWLLWRAARGAFDAHYFTPVDLGGLYWHLVDIIWIFLFPLLYLIH